MDLTKIEKSKIMENLLDDLIDSYKSSAQDRCRISDNLKDGEIILGEAELINSFYAGLAHRVKKGKKLDQFQEEIENKSIFSNANLRNLMIEHAEVYADFFNHILKIESLRSIIIFITREN